MGTIDVFDEYGNYKYPDYSNSQCTHDVSTTGGTMMGMTIEKCYLYGSCKCQTAGCVVLPDEGCPVYRYFKDLIVKDYENRLKADMVAMLEDIQMEIVLLQKPASAPSYDGDLYNGAFNSALYDVEDLIQQKISSLKAESEPQAEEEQTDGK